MISTLDEPRLWQAVVVRAVKDALWVDPNPTGNASRRVSFHGWICPARTARRMRDDAVFWIILDHSYFRVVCARAGLDPDYVRRGLGRAMEATDDEKQAWAATDLSLSDLWGASKLGG